MTRLNKKFQKTLQLFIVVKVIVLILQVSKTKNLHAISTNFRSISTLTQILIEPIFYLSVCRRTVMHPSKNGTISVTTQEFTVARVLTNATSAATHSNKLAT